MYPQRDLTAELSSDDAPFDVIDEIKENNRKLNLSRGKMGYEPTAMENESNGMDTDDYGLVGDIFLVNELNTSFPNSTGNASPFSSSDEDLVGLMKSATDERKPFESFEKQITITVPQPPPLKADAFTIGGGLFDGKNTQLNSSKLNSSSIVSFFLLSFFCRSGITDNTNILPASLISPVGTENSNYDYNMFDRTDLVADSLLDVWADEMK